MSYRNAIDLGRPWANQPLIKVLDSSILAKYGNCDRLMEVLEHETIAPLKKKFFLNTESPPVENVKKNFFKYREAICKNLQANHRGNDRADGMPIQSLPVR